MRRLQGHTAIVTGAGSGIGQGIAKRFAAEGANIVINYIAPLEGAQSTLHMVEAAGSQGLIVKADVSKPNEIERLINQAWAGFGSVNILINNAGIGFEPAFLEAKEEDFYRVIDVNLKAPFFVTQAFARKLSAEKKPGRVVNISSIHEDIVLPGHTSYCASKGGLRMLMRNLAVELAALGITVNNIAPGAIDTPMSRPLLENKPRRDTLLTQLPLNRIGTTEDVAALALFLASDEASYVTGATYYIDGGLSAYYNE
ncbi:glucose 1-dehydrogenase [Alloacidobacterium dinghuense]|uniref:Glucose 1-dehydrogenase n=1 Tax=Alloacidobacterium dinghuense TaxID=2763107 RepID=A0A7G8BIF2_9BACT|nr:glucose 1-dehydrogenase [Alloacidobacterium dinghuense]QNI32322.1 glucose 1-dehydrogenase [Alloacidobacterium dinghuense]